MLALSFPSWLFSEMLYEWSVCGKVKLNHCAMCIVTIVSECLSANESVIILENGRYGHAPIRIAGSQDPVLRRPSWCHREVGVRLQSPSSSYHPASVLWTIKRRVHGGWRVANTLWLSCVMRPVNSCRTCSLHVISAFARYKSSRYDSTRYIQYRFRYDTDPIIIRSLNVCLWFE